MRRTFVILIVFLLAVLILHCQHRGGFKYAGTQQQIRNQRLADECPKIRRLSRAIVYLEGIAQGKSYRNSKASSIARYINGATGIPLQGIRPNNYAPVMVWPDAVRYDIEVLYAYAIGQDYTFSPCWQSSRTKNPTVSQ